MGKYLIIPVIAIFAVVAMMVWVFPRSRRILESWAAESGYHILSSEIRWFRRGPFLWTTSKNQVVYYVTVRTHDGMVKQGWIRCGGLWGGVFKDKVEARWDE